MGRRRESRNIIENGALFDFSKYFTIRKTGSRFTNKDRRVARHKPCTKKDKMKEDVIANLSDKLIMLSERLDAVERSNK